jgi:hypothetical protein
MASLVVNRGLQGIADLASGVAGAPAAIATMTVDDGAAAFAAGNTGLGGPANLAKRAFDATPTRAGEVVTHKATFLTTEGNFTIRRIALHFGAAAGVSGTSATLAAGIDAQSITKTSDFSLGITVRMTYSNVA